MGQQQLLLIVLGVIIVGIAIAVGISMFKSNAQSSNRDQVINDLNNLAAKAQQFYRKPTAMAGGGQSFTGFALAPIDTGNGNGSYSVQSEGSAPSGTAYVPGSVTAAAASVDSVFITGCGIELGNNASTPVKAFVTIKNNTIVAQVLN
jgi:Tfp pilus assembly protein PilE